MDTKMMMYSELSFNILYLLVIWWLVYKMASGLKNLVKEDSRIPRYFYYAFLLLAIGDTGHVGFRVLAYMLGGLESKVDILGWNLPLVGAGALSTAITVTFFYMFLVVIWKLRFKEKNYGAYFGFQVLAIIRFIIMIFPQNEWANVVPPQHWSLYRNLPLTIIGVGLATHILMSNRKIKDPFYNRLAWLIFASYLFYLPVVLYVQKIPMLGMLMIPKTIAYVLMGLLVYYQFFKRVEKEL
jgi:hypothetical protein